jgi:hypothetical protein
MSRRGAKGGDRKSGQKYGLNRAKYNHRCAWCFVLFMSSRPEAKTNSPTCRSALSRYVKRHGSPPLFPFGVQPDRRK